MDAIAKPIQLLSVEASFITLDMLSQHRRPDNTLTQKSMIIPIYWKTGPSWGFRDAWSSGIFGPYVLVVWIGNFDGREDSTNQRSIEWYPKESGRYRIRAVDDKGRADTRNICVDIIGVINKQEIEAD